jgi:outer membrane protein
MRTSTKTIVAAGVASLALVPAAFAQAQKIAVLDYGRLLKESPQYRALGQVLDAEFLPRQKSLETQKKDFEARAAKFDRDQPTMGEAERTKAIRELSDMKQTLERHLGDLQQDQQAKQQEEFPKLQRLIEETVRTYAKAQGLDIVIAQGVIYAADTVDVTAPVLASLQAKAAAAAPPAAPAAAAAPPPKK